MAKINTFLALMVLYYAAKFEIAAANGSRYLQPRLRKKKKYIRKAKFACRFKYNGRPMVEWPGQRIHRDIRPSPPHPTHPASKHELSSLHIGMFITPSGFIDFMGDRLLCFQA